MDEWKQVADKYLQPVRGVLLDPKYAGIVNHQFKNFTLCNGRHSFAEIFNNADINNSQPLNEDAMILEGMIGKLIEHRATTSLSPAEIINRIIEWIKVYIAFDKMAEILYTWNAGNKKQFDFGPTKVELNNVEVPDENGLSVLHFNFIPVDPDFNKYMAQVQFTLSDYKTNWQDWKIWDWTFNKVGKTFVYSAEFITMLKDFTFNKTGETINKSFKEYKY